MATFEEQQAIRVARQERVRSGTVSPGVTDKEEKSGPLVVGGQDTVTSAPDPTPEPETPAEETQDDSPSEHDEATTETTVVETAPEEAPPAKKAPAKKAPAKKAAAQPSNSEETSQTPSE